MAFGQPSLKTKQFGGEGEMTEKICKCHFTIDRKMDIDFWSTRIEIYYTSSECTCLNIQNVCFLVQKILWSIVISLSVNRYSPFLFIKTKTP